MRRSDYRFDPRQGKNFPFIARLFGAEQIDG
jgi:hypothetical protein